MTERTSREEAEGVLEIYGQFDYVDYQEIVRLAHDYIALLDEHKRLRKAAEDALPLLRGRSCWHDDPEEPDCCEHGFIAERLSVALGNEPLPIYLDALGGDAQ